LANQIGSLVEFVKGQDVLAADMNANFDAIVTEFNSLVTSDGGGDFTGPVVAVPDEYDGDRMAFRAQGTYVSDGGSLSNFLCNTVLVTGASSENIFGVISFSTFDFNHNASLGASIFISDTFDIAAGVTLGTAWGAHLGISKSGSGTITDAIGLQILDITIGSTNRALKTGAGVVEFGDTVHALSNEEALFLGSNETDDTNKAFKIVTPSYDVDEEPVFCFGAKSISVGTRVYVGGGGGTGFNDTRYRCLHLLR